MNSLLGKFGTALLLLFSTATFLVFTTKNGFHWLNFSVGFLHDIFKKPSNATNSENDATWVEIPSSVTSSQPQTNNPDQHDNNVVAETNADDQSVNVETSDISTNLSLVDESHKIESNSVVLDDVVNDESENTTNVSHESNCSYR